MQNQVGPTGERYASNGARSATWTGNARVASPIAHLICDMDPKWRKERKYQRLFFLDEATAMAYGHRPCFRCRRSHFGRFQTAWKAAGLGPTTAGAMDGVIETERGRRHVSRSGRLPFGTMIEWEAQTLLVLDGLAVPWGETGYGPRLKLPTGEVAVVTPRSIVSVFSAGYRPALHPSAGAG